MQQFDNVIDLGDFIDDQQRKGVIKDVHEPERYDYLLDFSDRESETTYRLFGTPTPTA